MLKSTLTKSVFLFLVICLAAACKKEETLVPVLETKTFSNLYAPQTGGQGQPVGGDFIKFSFLHGTTVTDDSWDVAFRGATILVNGGTLIGIADEPIRTGIGAISIVTNSLDAVKEVPESSTFKQDGANTYAIPTGSDNGWYNYNSTTNLITPLAGKVFVVKTHDGKYAKFEIISYYKDAPTSPDATSLSRYYTFRYVYQPDGTAF
ncbi:MAG: HmuY family protein [Sphingobacteriales bacterium]|jgi:hypothetical protein|nr:HmuY family protein [Sphingobacteriales bacterium]MBP9142777.1 HmuY family protein [Chitinophagales bacterium]MDA0197767.1 HmuY family protein [Bacteroidota bacterium]MBK6890984.1 HmuY family protein [Sphingobacteriales bacterium]MBK7525965.1 HmuY family protein [Sphingobacteriales bacterium]